MSLTCLRIGIVASYPLGNQGGVGIIVGIIGGVIFFALAQGAVRYMD